jgi:hypothetical protein
MKTATVILTLVLGTLGLSTTTSQAQHSCQCNTRTAYCNHCGGTITYVLRVVGYECDGCPIRRWVQLPHCCIQRRPACEHDHEYEHSHGYSSQQYYQSYRNQCGQR